MYEGTSEIIGNFKVKVTDRVTKYEPLLTTVILH